MTYSVPDPADETVAPVTAGQAHEDPPLPPRLGSPGDDFGPVGSDPAPAGGAHRADDQLESGALVDQDVADAMAVDADASTTDEPLRVPREDSEEFEQFISDPEAAEAATRERMNAQAEAEKAAAGVNPAEDS